MYLRAHSPIAHMLNKLCSFSLYSFQWWKTDLRCSRTISGDCGLQTENRWGNAGLIRDAIIKHNVPLSRVMIMEATYTCSCQNKGALADIWRNKKYDALVIHLPWELLKQVKSMTPNVVQRWSRYQVHRCLFLHHLVCVPVCGTGNVLDLLVHL